MGVGWVLVKDGGFRRRPGAGKKRSGGGWTQRYEGWGGVGPPRPVRRRRWRLARPKAAGTAAAGPPTGRARRVVREGSPPPSPPPKYDEVTAAGLAPAANGVLVVGGAVGGLAMGIAPSQLGILATFLKRRPHLRDGDPPGKAGADLALWPEGVGALVALGVPRGVLQRRLGRVGTVHMARLTEGEEEGGGPAGETAGGRGWRRGEVGERLRRTPSHSGRAWRGGG